MAGKCSIVDADDPLIWYEGAGTAASGARYVYADPRGSIILVGSGTGASLAINSYDEYGIPDTASGYDIATKGRFRYTGQAWLPELGMYYYKARIYSPTLGRFMQTDPIGYEDQFNLYAYVGNDPVNAVDPTGMQSLPCIGEPCNQIRAIWGRPPARRSSDARLPSQNPAATALAAAAATASTGSAAATGQQNLPRRVTIDTQGSQKGRWRFGSSSGRPATGNGSYRVQSARSLGVAAGRVLTPAAVAFDTASQSANGKPVDQAFVNAGSRGLFAYGVGSVGLLLAPETLGSSAVLAGGVLFIDQAVGGKVGDFAESLYLHGMSGPPEEWDYDNYQCRGC